ncbi:MAG: hypothetical protein PHQ89_00865 [Bacilli bacterium]|nr:hypothetical protein [Bacilli bacterium]
MTKEVFLEKLKKNINILEEKEQIKIINKYKNIIEEDIKSGKTEEESIKALGDINKLTKKILKEYKISNDYIEKNSNNFEDIISRFINYIVDGTKEFISKVEKKDFKAVTEIIIYILIAMFAFWILKIPFYIVELIGNGIFNLFVNPIGIGLSFLWSFIVNVCYILLVIWIIVIIFNKITKKDLKEEIIKKVNQTKEEKESVNEEVKEEKIIKNKTKMKSVPLEILYILIKVLVIIMILPLIFMQIGLFIALGAIIVLIAKGIILIGPLLMLIGFIIILGVVTSLIFYLTFSKGGNK